MTIDPDLGTLEASGLIRLAAMEPELEYLFRHVLVQDAAYGSLLRDQRRELHARVAAALARVYPDRLAELAGVLALHWERAGDPARAAEYLVRAGDHAAERFANREASDEYSRAFALVPTDERPELRRLRAQAAIGAARTGWGFGSFDEAIARLDQAIPLAEAIGDARLLSEAHFWNAFLRGLRGEQPLSSPAMAASLEQAERLAVDEGDAVMRAFPEAVLGAGLTFSGDLREGAGRIEAALRILDRSADPLSLAMLSGFASMAHARLGDFAAAERAVARADALAERGDPIARLDAQITRAVIDLERGDLERGVALAGDCAARSEEIGATACAIISNLFVGQGLLQLDRPAEARPLLESALQRTTASVRQSLHYLGLGAWSTASGRLGELAAAREGWEAAIAGARASGDRLTEALLLRHRGATLARAGGRELDQALADLDSALAILERSEARPAIARTLRDQAVVLRLAGREEDAAAVDSRSRSLAAELGLRDFPPVRG